MTDPAPGADMKVKQTEDAARDSHERLTTALPSGDAGSVQGRCRVGAGSELFAKVTLGVTQ